MKQGKELFLMDNNEGDYECDHYDNSLDMLSSGLTAYKLSTDGMTTIL